MSVTDYLEQQRTTSFDAARDNDLDIILPADNEITLDIDRPWPNSIGKDCVRYPDVDSVQLRLLFLQRQGLDADTRIDRLPADRVGRGLEESRRQHARCLDPVPEVVATSQDRPSSRARKRSNP